MKIRLLTFILCIGYTLSAQVGIPDSIFEQRLIDLNYDDTLNGWVLIDTINMIDTLDISGFNGQIDKITDLTGIEYFTNLEYLNCSNNKFDTLDLNKNNKLKHIICTADSIDILMIDSLYSLYKLQCNSNNITTLNLLGNPALTELWCWDNLLDSIDLSNNIYLGDLFCGENNLKSLDLSAMQLPGLINLRCQNNIINTLDLTNNPALETLICYNNNLENIFLHDNPNVNLLNIGNVASQPSPFNNNFNSLDISNNCDLTVFYSKGLSNLQCIQVCDTLAANNWNTQNIDPQHYFSDNCNYTAINETTQENSKVMSIKDIYGRESSKKTNSLLFFQYKDGTVVKQIILDK